MQKRHEDFIRFACMLAKNSDRFVFRRHLEGWIGSMDKDCLADLDRALNGRTPAVLPPYMKAWRRKFPQEAVKIARAMIVLLEMNRNQEPSDAKTA